MQSAAINQARINLDIASVGRFTDKVLSRLSLIPTNRDIAINLMMEFVNSDLMFKDALSLRNVAMDVNEARSLIEALIAFSESNLNRGYSELMNFVRANTYNRSLGLDAVMLDVQTLILMSEDVQDLANPAVAQRYWKRVALMRSRFESMPK